MRRKFLQILEILIEILKSLGWFDDQEEGEEGAGEPRAVAS